MVTNLLPGLREIRAPLISGYLWLVFFFLAFNDDLPSHEEAPPTLQPLFDLGHDLSAFGIATVSGVAAYLLGSAVQELLKLVCGIFPGKPFYGEAGTHLSTAGRADVKRAVTVRVQGIRRRLFQVALSPGEKGVDDEPSAEVVERELPLIRTLLLGEHGDLIAELDRLQAEADLRIMIALPLIVFSIYLSLEVSAIWLLASLGAALLLAQGYQRQVEVGDLLAKALRIGKVSAPSLESLDASAAAAIERIELEEDLATKVSEGQSPMAAFRLGNLQATGENFEAAIASLRFAAEHGVIHAYAEIGLVYEQVGELDDAERAYRDGEKRKDKRATQRLAVLLRGLERDEEALETVRRVEGELDEEDAQDLKPPVPSTRSRILDYNRRLREGDAKAAINLGLLRQRQGEWSEAIDAFERATQLDGEDPQAWLSLALALGEVRRAGEAAAAYREALAILERTLGREHLEVASTLVSLGLALNELGEYEEARDLLERAMVIHERDLGSESLETAVTLGNLALSLIGLGKVQSGQEMEERVLGIKEKLLSPDHPRVAHTLRNLGATYFRVGRYMEGKELFERALSILEGSSEDNVNDLSLAIDNLGEAFDTFGDYHEAKALHQRALEMKKESLGEGHRSVAISRSGLGDSLFGLGKYERGLRLQERALADMRTSDGPDSQVIGTLLSTSQALRGLHRWEEALDQAETALLLANDGSPPADSLRGDVFVEIGHALNGLGRFPAAASRLRKGLVLIARDVGSDHLYQVSGFLGLGRAMRGLGNRSSAEKRFRAAERILEAAPISHDPALAEVRGEIAEILHHQGRLEEAKRSILQSIELQERSTDSAHPKLAISFDLLGSILDSMGDAGGAADARKRAGEIRGER